jgi:excisionase family DNA binding protein
MGDAEPHTGEGIGVLRGWKEIAQYLRTSERTATRWSIEKALPVHRSGRGSLVVAYRSELDGWQKEVAAAAGSLTDAPESPLPSTDTPTTSTGRKRRLMTGMYVLGALVFILGLTWSDKLVTSTNLLVRPRNDEQEVVS